MKKHCFLWLTLRLMKKQKSESRSVFCCMLFSSILLHVFCGLGCYFFNQVHGEKSGAASFGLGQLILAALAAVLLILVFSCSAVLIRNLFSLTFVQRWKSLGRFFILGATGKDILFMAAAETGLLMVIAVPAGCMLSILIGRLLGFRLEMPFWILAGIQMWLALFSCCCGVLPVWRALCRPLQLSGTGYIDVPMDVFCRRADGKKGYGKSGTYIFAGFMSEKYYLADRKRHRRIVFTILAAVLLYVPAAYLIDKNLEMDRSGFLEKYGITYTCTPKDREQLQAAMEECRNLKAEAASASAEAVSYVCMPGTAFIASALLSSDLLSALEKAGWTEERELHADCDIYFLDDECYGRYLQSCTVLDRVSAADRQVFPVLVNRYMNRTSYKKDASLLFRETALLHEDAIRAVNENARSRATELAGRTAVLSDLKIYCGILQEQPDQRKCMYPAVCCDELPEGIRAGNVTVILPLSQLSVFCPDFEQYGWGMSVCALFADTEETLFETLQQELGRNAAGKLRNDRQEYLEWYDSLHEIHLALLAVCGNLFFTALLQVFSMLLFHCMQRRHGLAVLWSLGQTRQSLTAILALESLHSFVRAMLLAIPVSCGLCYYIYCIYRYVWQTAFALPLEQLARIAGMLAVTAAAAVAVSRERMNRQDFLQEIRNM